MQPFKSIPTLPTSPMYRFLIKTLTPALFARSSFCSSLANCPTSNSPALYRFLMETFKFSETEALSISIRLSHIKSTEKPQAVLHYFQNLGFSSSHIKSAVRLAPELLVAKIDKRLDPKIRVFQGLGLVGHDLGKFISKNPILLTASLESKLVPRIEILKKILLEDKNNENLIKVISRCNWLLSRYPESRLISNIALLESCGIVGSQLAMLLRRQPRLFVTEESKVRNLISKTSNMGFSVSSRMFAHGLLTASGISEKTRGRKYGVLMSFGYSECECTEMFLKVPPLLRCSEKKLKLGIDFFLNRVKIEKRVLVGSPQCLMISMEERVIPRYKVLEIIKSKRLLKKQPSFRHVLHYTEGKFVAKFIAKFPDEAESLLMAYKGHNVGSSSEDECS